MRDKVVDKTLNVKIVCFKGEELLAFCPNPKLEGHALSAVRDSLFYIFAATLLIGGRSSIRNRRMRHAVVTEANLSRKIELRE